MFWRLTWLIAAVSAIVAAATAQVPPNVKLVHAGQLMHRPGEPVMGPATIVIVDGRIVEVREGHISPSAAGKPEAQIVDLKDRFVLPGLIDTHVHLFIDPDTARAARLYRLRDAEDWAYFGADNARRTLEAGFTTVRDLSGDPRAGSALRDAIMAGTMPGPTMLIAGRGISVTAGHNDRSNNTNRDTAAIFAAYDNICNGADDCRRAVRAQIGNGADVIKFMATGGVLSEVAGGLERQMHEDEMVAIIETARLFGRRVAAHAYGKEGIKSALLAGVHSIEHGSFTDDETNALFRRTGAYLVPTRLAAETGKALNFAGQRSAEVVAKSEATNRAADTNVARAIKSGVKIAYGTDTGVGPHGANAGEFRLLVALGMTPTEAIRTATVNAADLLGRSDRIGTIEPGKQADLIAVRDDPTGDVTVLERIDFVMRQGVIHKQDGRRSAFPPN